MNWNKVMKKITILGMTATVFAGSLFSAGHAEAKLEKKGKYMNNNAELTVNTSKKSIGCYIYYPVKTSLEITTRIYIPTTNGKYKQVLEHEHVGTITTTQIGIFTGLSDKDQKDGKVIAYSKTSAKVSGWQFVANGDTRTIYTDWAQ